MKTQPRRCNSMITALVLIAGCGSTLDAGVSRTPGDAATTDGSAVDQSADGSIDGQASGAALDAAGNALPGVLSIVTWGGALAIGDCVNRGVVMQPDPDDPLWFADVSRLVSWSSLDGQPQAWEATRSTVCFRSAGPVSLQARLGDLVANTTLDVKDSAVAVNGNRRTLQGLTNSPRLVVAAPGTVTRVHAVARFTDGWTRPGAVQWSVADGAVTSVAAPMRPSDGVTLTHSMAGRTTLTSRFGDLVGVTDVLVAHELDAAVQLRITPDSPRGPLVASPLTHPEVVSLHLQGVWPDGSSWDLTDSATWTATPPSTLSFGFDKGQIVCTSTGPVQVTARLLDRTISTTVSCEAPVEQFDGLVLVDPTLLPQDSAGRLISSSPLRTQSQLSLLNISPRVGEAHVFRVYASGRDVSSETTVTTDSGSVDAFALKGFGTVFYVSPRRRGLYVVRFEYGGASSRLIVNVQD